MRATRQTIQYPSRSSWASQTTDGRSQSEQTPFRNTRKNSMQSSSPWNQRRRRMTDKNNGKKPIPFPKITLDSGKVISASIGHEYGMHHVQFISTDADEIFEVFKKLSELTVGVK